jgi:hypothetical protein
MQPSPGKKATFSTIAPRTRTNPSGDLPGKKPEHIVHTPARLCALQFDEPKRNFDHERLHTNTWQMLTTRPPPVSFRDCRGELDNYAGDQKRRTHQARSCTGGTSTTCRKPVQRRPARLREGVFVETQSPLPGELSVTRRARQGADELLRVVEPACNPLPASLFPPVTPSLPRP